MFRPIALALALLISLPGAVMAQQTPAPAKTAFEHEFVAIDGKPRASSWAHMATVFASGASLRNHSTPVTL